MNNNEVTFTVPTALQYLIKSNNELLKKYQQELLLEVQEANLQMMQLLRIDPQNGWQLDMERMVYVREKTEEEMQQSQESSQPTE